MEGIYVGTVKAGTGNFCECKASAFSETSQIPESIYLWTLTQQFTILGIAVSSVCVSAGPESLFLFGAILYLLVPPKHTYSDQLNGVFGC